MSYRANKQRGFFALTDLINFNYKNRKKILSISKYSICDQLRAYKLNSETRTYDLIPIHERTEKLAKQNTCIFVT